VKGRAMRALYIQALIGGQHPQIVFGAAALIGTIAMIWFHPHLSRARGRRIPLFNGRLQG
jgi:hypothetical protein